MGHKLEVWFLTSSEADSLAFAEGFAAFKIPSKTIAHEAGLDRRAYVALAKQWVWHTLGLLRPDLLVVDTFPRGSFGELIGAFDLCRHTAFVYRPVRPEVAARPDFQAMLGQRARAAEGQGPRLSRRSGAGARALGAPSARRRAGQARDT
jgi:hypothetical protein